MQRVSLDSRMYFQIKQTQKRMRENSAFYSQSDLSIEVIREEKKKPKSHDTIRYGESYA